MSSELRVAVGRCRLARGQAFACIRGDRQRNGQHLAELRRTAKCCPTGGGDAPAMGAEVTPYNGGAVPIGCHTTPSLSTSVPSTTSKIMVMDPQYLEDRPKQ